MLVEGKPVIKTRFTKQSEEQLAMKLKMRRAIGEALVPSPASSHGRVPEHLEQILMPLRTALDTIAELGEKTNEEFEEEAFGHLTSDQIVVLETILKQGALKPEERLTQIANLMIPALATLDVVDRELKLLALQIHTAFSDSYVERFTVQKGNGFVLNHNACLEMLKQHMKVRKAMSKKKASASGAAADDDDVKLSVLRSCVVS